MVKLPPLNDCTNAHKPSATHAPDDVPEKGILKIVQQKLELAKQTTHTYDLPRILTTCT